MNIGFDNLTSGENYINVNYGTNENMKEEKIIKVNNMLLFGITEIIADKSVNPLLTNVMWIFKSGRKIIATYFMSPKQHLEIHIDSLGGACYTFK